MAELQGVAGRLAAIEARIAAACARAGRDRAEVTLVAVSKTVAVDRIREAIAAGVRVLGENRVQEAAEKIPLLTPAGMASRPAWHLIGRLQSNKARRAVELFDAIHSVDSLKLAVRLDGVAGELGKRLPVFIEVNLGGEESKAGLSSDEALSLCEALQRLPHLELRGLMTVPPFLEDPEALRPYFRRLRDLRDEARASGIVGPAFRDLSMGMSNDFEVAIEEGATLVRIGTALFGERG
ncbi:MAG: YggS family pyridoxal phosphate-dependent enzyme [Blastocatellia bacterium]|nr:YggS family pyridoxal phosphate-dependent enzyme [Blastocatellia bacterium]